MQLFVIMSNDFPAGVMDDEAAAQALVDARNRAEASAEKTGSTLGRSRVFWRAYAFELNRVRP